MEGGGVLSATDQQTMVSSFLEIAVGQTADTARQFLQATSWKLEEAIQLFYVGHEGGAAALSPYIPPLENDGGLPNQNTGGSENQTGSENIRENDGSEVRAPLPVKRDVLYDTPMLYGATRLGYTPHEARTVVPFRNFDEELKRPGVWETDQGATSTADASRDNLATLYRPPFALMYHGPFEKAKEAAKSQDRWLLVNLQSTREFSSHMLNRDTWANEAVSQTITSNFIFWQVCDDTEEGSKIKTYYKLDSVPVTLVIDPVTGQKMRLWRGMVQPENLLEDLLQFMDGSPKDHHFSLSHKRPRENSQAPPPKIQATPGSFICSISCRGKQVKKMKICGWLEHYRWRQRKIVLESPRKIQMLSLTPKKRSRNPRNIFIHRCLKNLKLIGHCFAGSEFVFQMDAGFKGPFYVRSNTIAMVILLCEPG
ncbi:hypothetical protein OSB04_008762 [Centaurea solstitialis]|uniref:UAS domain-containing protein n=1 Tax=Centaurea solstitialis TaxID=347529 RepID=A0AA38WJU7_9ASTR|nr:hypothetical protein OSB04_008762 [Centaurea solstitialis]